MYDVINEFYHRQITKDCDYDKWCEYICELLGDNKNGVELGCGTGLMTYRLAKHGKRLVGVDISEEMLTIAEKRLKSVPNAPLFVCADMLDCTYQKNRDFFVSVCDGLNYIAPSEMPRLMKRVYASLKGGGVFTFDISSEFKLRRVLADNVFYIEEDKTVCLWVNKQLSGSVVMDLTLFSEEEDGRYVRSGERHIQYVHSEEFIVNELRRAGFEDVTVTDFLSYKRENAEAERLQFTGFKK